jgi:hypothetical protein
VRWGATPMSEPALSGADFEQAYESLAAAIDRVGRERESEFLARLALLLMHAPPVRDAVLAAIEAAERALR